MFRPRSSRAKDSSAAPPPPAPRMSLRSHGTPPQPQVVQSQQMMTSNRASSTSSRRKGAPGGGLPATAYGPSLHASVSSSVVHSSPLASMTNSVPAAPVQAKKRMAAGFMSRASLGSGGNQDVRNRAAGSHGGQKAAFFGAQSHSPDYENSNGPERVLEAYTLEMDCAMTLPIEGSSDDEQMECEESSEMGFGLLEGPPPKATKKKMRRSAPVEPPSLPSEPLHALIALQDFEGSWVLNKSFCQLLRLDMAKIQAAATKMKVDGKVLATALAVRFFEKKLGKDRDTWELVVDKARGWLEMQGYDEKSQVWSVDGLLT
jgi:hypothetical protein